jgi:hypothetical protein
VVVLIALPCSCQGSNQGHRPETLKINTAVVSEQDSMGVA